MSLKVPFGALMAREQECQGGSHMSQKLRRVVLDKQLQGSMCQQSNVVEGPAQSVLAYNIMRMFVF